jgi:hypothetical protein
VGNSRNSNHINTFGIAHPLSLDYWIQIQEISEQANEVVEKYDNVTKLYGKKPTNEQILEMARHKGIVYQRKGKDGPNKYQTKFPKVITPLTTNLTVDLGNWISNAKFLVPVLDLLKIPS